MFLMKILGKSELFDFLIIYCIIYVFMPVKVAAPHCWFSIYRLLTRKKRIHVTK